MHFNSEKTKHSLIIHSYIHLFILFYICSFLHSPFLGCIEAISVRATTSTVEYAFSNSPHKFQITVGGEIRSVTIPCAEDKNCSPGVTRIFTYDIDQFFQGTTVPCVKQDGISQYALAQGGNEGWNIQSIYATLVTCGGGAIATSDRNFNKWVDGNGTPDQKLQVLTPV